MPTSVIHRHLPLILSFLGRHHTKETLDLPPSLVRCLAAVSPLARLAVLECGVLQLGNWSIRRVARGVSYILMEYNVGDRILPDEVAAVEALPVGGQTSPGPVCWQAPVSSCAVLLAMARATVAGGGRAAPTGLVLKADVEPEETEGKQYLRQLLTVLGPYLEYFEVEHLSDADVPISEPSSAWPRRLRKLSVTYYHGMLLRLAQWVSYCPLQAVQVCNTPSVTTAALALLSPPTVEELFLDDTNATPSMMQALARCAPVLRLLSLVDCIMIDTIDLQEFTALQSLYLSRTPITTEELNGLGACRRLHHINLAGCRNIRDLGPVFADLPALRQLFLYETSLTNTGISPLGCCRRLEQLNLGGCVAISDVNVLGDLVYLRELHLWSTRITNAGIAGLGRCMSLEELVLDNCNGISDVSPLRHLMELRWLSLMATQVDREGIARLAECPRLETLGIAGTRIENTPKLWNAESVRRFLTAARESVGAA